MRRWDDLFGRPPIAAGRRGVLFGEVLPGRVLPIEGRSNLAGKESGSGQVNGHRRIMVASRSPDGGFRLCSPNAARASL